MSFPKSVAQHVMTSLTWGFVIVSLPPPLKTIPASHPSLPHINKEADNLYQRTVDKQTPWILSY